MQLCKQKPLHLSLPLTIIIAHVSYHVNGGLRNIVQCGIIASIKQHRPHGALTRRTGEQSPVFYNMPSLSAPLTADQHAAIRRKASALGVPQAEVARRLLLAWVRGEMEMPVYREATEFDQTIERIVRGYKRGQKAPNHS